MAIPWSSYGMLCQSHGILCQPHCLKWLSMTVAWWSHKATVVPSQPHEDKTVPSLPMAVHGSPIAVPLSNHNPMAVP